MNADDTSNTPEPDEPDLDPDAPGLHQWARRRALSFARGWRRW
jgi:hypothetical protein